MTKRVGYPVDGQRAGTQYEGRVGPEAAPQPNVDRLDDLLADVGGVAAKADVCDLWLSAGGRAARKVHPDDAGIAAGHPRAAGDRFPLPI